MPDDPVETLLEVEVSPLGKYLLCALAGFAVGVVLGVTIARIIPQVDSLPPDVAYAPVETEVPGAIDPDDLERALDAALRLDGDDPDTTGE